MNDVAVLLDKAKKTLSANSDAELARQLGVTRASVSNWRTGRNLPDVVQCATIAGLTGEPLAKVLGIVGEARAISAAEKKVWRRLATSAVALFLMLAATLPAAPCANATEAATLRVIDGGNVYYVIEQGRSWPRKAFQYPWHASLTVASSRLSWSKVRRSPMRSSSARRRSLAALQMALGVEVVAPC